jgi:hypothetical protein
VKLTGSFFSRALAVTALVAFVPSCTTAIVAGAVVVAAGGAAVLAHACYDFVDIQVLDGATGSRICDAVVTAAEEGSSSADELNPCYHAHLSDGSWTIVAQRAGYLEASTKVTVEHVEGCERQVQSVNLTLVPIGAAAPALAPTPAPAPIVVPPAPGPGPASTSTSTSAPAPGATPAPAPASTPPAPPSAPVKSFPDAPPAP